MRLYGPNIWGPKLEYRLPNEFQVLKATEHPKCNIHVQIPYSSSNFSQLHLYHINNLDQIYHLNIH